MQLDIATVSAVVAFVVAMAGIFLLITGWQYRAGPAAIWGAANMVAAVGTILIAGGHFSSLSSASVTLAPLLTWTSMRRFNRRRVLLLPLAAATVVWALSTVPAIRVLPSMTPGVLIALFYSATAYELWRSRGEKLNARWPMLTLVVLHSLVTISVNAAGFISGAAAISGPWLMNFETLVFSVGTCVFLVAMIKERAVAEERSAARHDSLTGLLTRGAFLHTAGRLVTARSTGAGAVAVAVFDLDAFKRINDTFGHRCGDSVLQRFAQTARRSLRTDDLIGRLGGDEFALVLEGAGPDAAMALVEQIRSAFAEDARWVDGRPVSATVSAGLAMSDGDPAIDRLLDRADQALYAAKSRGRNRTHRVEAAAVDSVVIRIA